MNEEEVKLITDRINTIDIRIRTEIKTIKKQINALSCLVFVGMLIILTTVTMILSEMI